MKLSTIACILGVCLIQKPSPSQAEDLPAVKVGIVSTLTGSAAVLGQQVRNGFALALAQHKGKLGGRAAQIIIVDDEQKPEVAAPRVEKLLVGEQVDFVVGPVSANILAAIYRPVTSSNALLISPYPGPAAYAGKECSADFFVTSYQDSEISAALGKYAQDKGYRRAFLLAPNTPSGKDAAFGFSSTFKGESAAPDFVPGNQIDFQADLSRLATSKSDLLFVFMPGGAGVALVKQFHQSGLADKLPFLSAATLDEATLPGEQAAANGLLGAMTWAPDLNNAANLKFVEQYLDTFHSLPGAPAMQGFDAAQAIDAALAHTGGKVDDRAKLRDAMRLADFSSPRGKFRFGANGYPIQDYYLVKAGKRGDGLYQTEIVQKIFANRVDGFAPECRN